MFLSQSYTAHSDTCIMMFTGLEKKREIFLYRSGIYQPEAKTSR